MNDFIQEYGRLYNNALQAGAIGRKGYTRPKTTYLGLTPIPDDVKKVLKMKSDTSKPKKSKESKKAPKSKKLLSKSNEPPKNSKLQQRLLDLGWDRYARYEQSSSDPLVDKLLR
jgi:hypothetical protein